MTMTPSEEIRQKKLAEFNEIDRFIKKNEHCFQNNSSLYCAFAFMTIIFVFSSLMTYAKYGTTYFYKYNSDLCEIVGVGVVFSDENFRSMYHFEYDLKHKNKLYQNVMSDVKQHGENKNANDIIGHTIICFLINDTVKLSHTFSYPDIFLFLMLSLIDLSCIFSLYKLFTYEFMEDKLLKNDKKRREYMKIIEHVC
jgi:hypothetical protein